MNNKRKTSTKQERPHGNSIVWIPYFVLTVPTERLTSPVPLLLFLDCFTPALNREIVEQLC